jgi:hypothetical protein
MPLRDDLIIEKCIEIFNDSSPCFIHRSAVMKRLYAELEEYLEYGLKNCKKEWYWNELPPSIQLVLSMQSGINRVMFL